MLESQTQVLKLYIKLKFQNGFKNTYWSYRFIRWYNILWYVTEETIICKLLNVILPRYTVQ